MLPLARRKQCFTLIRGYGCMQVRLCAIRHSIPETWLCIVSLWEGCPCHVSHSTHADTRHVARHVGKGHLHYLCDLRINRSQLSYQ